MNFPHPSKKQELHVHCTETNIARSQGKSEAATETMGDKYHILLHCKTGFYLILTDLIYALDYFNAHALDYFNAHAWHS